MENYLYGRLTTLNYLRDRRDDASRHHIVRMRADRALRKIVGQLRDRNLMKLRERLLRAQKYGDLHAVWMIEMQIFASEKRYELTKDIEYTQREEDEA